MAQTSAITARAARRAWFDPVLRLRLAIIATVLIIWELVAASGLLYRDVVPSLVAIGRAIITLLINPEFYYHLGVSMGEIGSGLVIGGVLGLIVGLVLGANRTAGGGLRVVSLLSRSDAEDHLSADHDHVVWRRPRLESRHGRAVVFLSGRAVRSLGDCARSTRCLIKVGESFRANTWQMATKIYLPAIRVPLINGMRLGLGVALIGTLLAETRLSNKASDF